MSKSKIEWTDRTWEPVQGCTPVSSGCIECWAKRLAEGRMKRFYPEGFGKVVLREDKLKDVTPRQKPAMIFVCSRSDLFHPDVPFSLIYRVLMIIKDCSQHTFQILTKRPDRMEIFFRHAKTDGLLFQNLWLGVSVEDQKTADERIPLLLQCQAAVRFVSLEPCLGAVDFTKINLGIKQTKGYGNRRIYWDILNNLEHQYNVERNTHRCQFHITEGVDGVILGGESGLGARPMHPDWPRKVRDDCQAAGVPFHFKQWGEWRELQGALRDPALADLDLVSQARKIITIDGADYIWTGKKAAGRLLDGIEHNELPEVMRLG